MIKKLSLIAIAALCYMTTNPAHAGGALLTGDEKLACEAMLCLVSPGKRPSECEPSIRRYFNIHKRLWSDTVRARKNFLRKCPKK